MRTDKSDLEMTLFDGVQLEFEERTRIVDVKNMSDENARKVKTFTSPIYYVLPV